MIQEHEKPEKIAKYTGYSIDQIQKLEKEHCANN